MTAKRNRSGRRVWRNHLTVDQRKLLHVKQDAHTDQIGYRTASYELEPDPELAEKIIRNPDTGAIECTDCRPTAGVNIERIRTQRSAPHKNSLRQVQLAHRVYYGPGKTW